MKIISAIAAVPARPGSPLLAERKIIAVVLDSDDMDKLQDRDCITINVEEAFPEFPRASVVLVHHNNVDEGVQAFKDSFNLIYFDGKRQ